MPKSILLVDDNATVRRLICRCLESESHLKVCGQAVDGHDAIEKAQRLKPDLIILDLSMPVMNGLEAAKILSKLMPHVPLALLTADDRELTQPHARAAGIATVISKLDGVAKLCVKSAPSFARCHPPPRPSAPPTSRKLRAPHRCENIDRPLIVSSIPCVTRTPQFTPQARQRFTKPVSAAADDLYCWDAETRKSMLDVREETLEAPVCHRNAGTRTFRRKTGVAAYSRLRDPLERKSPCPGALLSVGLGTHSPNIRVDISVNLHPTCSLKRVQRPIVVFSAKIRIPKFPVQSSSNPWMSNSVAASSR